MTEADQLRQPPAHCGCLS